ncbi:hypothetical protein ACS0TY_026998 [Phlomoides rotata]
MTSIEEKVEVEDANGNSLGKIKIRLKDRSQKVAHTKEMLSKQAVQAKEILSKQAVKIAKQAEEHERFINKVTHLIGVLGFGGFCFILGARCSVFILFILHNLCSPPMDILQIQEMALLSSGFCYYVYANTIFIIMLLFYPSNAKLFMVCFSFAEGPLAWALIVWRCSLVFNSVDKIVSVFIHLLPGLVFFTIRWWDPVSYEVMHSEGSASRASSPYVENKTYLWTWLFFIPLVVYIVWQLLYFLFVDVLRRQRLLRDPEVMTSYRELSKKAQKAMFTVATTALTVPIFLSYELHVTFQILKVSASVWNGGNFLLEVMPIQVIQKEKKKMEMQPIEADQVDQSVLEKSVEANNPSQSHVVESE